MPQKLKIAKKFTGINQSSERAPFSTSYLQLALAHARNSRLKKKYVTGGAVTGQSPN